MNEDIFINRNAVLKAIELGKLLTERNFSCATAESCTAGMIGAAITAIAGSSAYFRGGIIAYGNDVKTGLLGVSRRILDRYGAVSAETVCAMAQGAARLLGADCCVSVSGIAGPGGGSAEKPVGLVFTGTFVCGRTAAFRDLFNGDRSEVRTASVAAALQHLIEQISSPR